MLPTFLLVGCPNPSTPVIVVPTATTVVPSPGPPTVTPPPSTHAAFWPQFVDAACDAGIQCGARATLDHFDCPDGSAEPSCVGFDPAAAEACLDADWTCDAIAGTAVAMAPLACNVVCDPPEDTGAPTTVPTPPRSDPTFHVELTDGDGLPDDTNGPDLDTLTLTITDAPAGVWEFGYAQTAVGSLGWYGESCFNGDTCHPIPAPDGAGTSTLLLTRVFTPDQVTEGTSMLLPVDQPPEATLDLTYYVGTPDDVNTDCVVWGHDPTYYATLTCSDPGLRATTNDH